MVNDWNAQGKAWNASWIWGGAEDWPRNEWRCFRREFDLRAWTGAAAELAITADARYVLYVNGELCGRGPGRSWPSELSYDVYEVGHLLRSGTNTIAVLVISFGVATFAYLPGRGGLLAELASIGPAGETTVLAGTDDSWHTAPYGGYERRAPRMSCQLGFAEQVDGREREESWLESGFEAASWERARVIGQPGDAPWTALVPSAIPPLTEETKWPVRVESLKRVKPVAWTAFLDIRNAMEPGSVRHANRVSFAGYVAAVIRASRDADATIGFVSSFDALRGIGLNGRFYGRDQMEGERPERYAHVRLRQGDNFLWVETTGTDHGGGLHMGIDCEAAFKIVSPLTGEAEPTPFALIGPFATHVEIDHQPSGTLLTAYEGFGGNKPLDRDAFAGYDDYVRFREASAAADLSGFRNWVKPFPSDYAAPRSVFAASVWKGEEEAMPVPASLHNACIANRMPAVIPVYPDGDTAITLDYGKEWSGYLRFEVDAPEGAVIEAYGFEYMRDGWRQETYGLDNTLRYTCREGRQAYESPVRRGLRYLLLTVRSASRPVKLYGVQLAQSNYPVAEIGRFHSSDRLLNDIWEISKHTTRLCMEDTFVDCPAYEQVFWVGDSRNEALVNYYVFGAVDIVKRCLELVPGSRMQTPLYANQVPSGWSSVIPNWTFFWSIACLEYARHTGDETFAADAWPKVKFTLERYLERVDERGLLFIRGWNLLDWAPIDQPGEGVVTHQNMILARALADAAELAVLAGAPSGEGAAYRRASEALIAAVNAHLWSEDRQAYIDCIHADGRRSETCSMQTQVVALVNGAADGERRERLAGYMIDPPRDMVQIGSPFMAFFYYEALAELGRYDLMLRDMRRHYGEMVDYEATTCWEMYPNFAENRANPNLLTRSHCHAWSAAPGFFLGACVLGVRPLAPGWTRVRVAPKPDDLEWARGAVPLPGGGRIDVSWRIAEEAGERVFRLEVRAPGHIELELEGPRGMRTELIRLAL